MTSRRSAPDLPERSQTAWLSELIDTGIMINTLPREPELNRPRWHGRFNGWLSGIEAVETESG